MNRLVSIIHLLVASLVLNAVLALVANKSAANENSEPMRVSYLKLKDFDAHYAYRYQLIDRALELTRPEFGDFRYQPFGSQITSTRYAQLLNEGVYLKC